MGKAQFRSRKHRSGVRSQLPKTRESRIRERQLTGLQAAYHKIDTNIRVKRFRLRRRLQELKTKKVLTEKQAEENLRKADIEMEAEKVRLKMEAAKEYDQLLGSERIDNEADAGDMNFEDDEFPIFGGEGSDNERQESDEASDLNAEQSESDTDGSVMVSDLSDDDDDYSDFESDRDDVSGDEGVNQEEMERSFKEIWGARTKEIGNTIRTIETLGAENEEDMEEEDLESGEQEKN
jgi:hypothetical protein